MQISENAGRRLICLSAWRMSGQNSRTLLGSQEGVQFSKAGIEFFAQHVVSFDRIAPDFLIGGVGQRVQIRDVSLQFGLAIPNRRSDQPRRELIEPRRFWERP